MRTVKLLSVIACLTMIMSVMVYSTSDEMKKEVPYTDTRDTVTSPYWYKKLETYSSEEAAAAGVPEGYEGCVMKLVGDSSVGLTIDFSSRQIPISSVKALHMRVYYNEPKIREVRVTIDAGYSWVLRHEAKKQAEWEDVVITDPNSLKQLANEEGRLGRFGFGFRFQDGTYNAVVYVDEIRAELIDDDKTPPVIYYDGEDHIVTTEGKPFVLNVRAYDEGEKAEFPIEYIWSENATDDGGKLVKGEYSLTLRVRDSFGNASEKKLTVTVGDRDVTAPVIKFKCDKIETAAGAYVKLAISAEDDCDDVTVTQEWSEGAIDSKGRVTEGTHTLTLTCSDLTGNTATRTVTVAAGKTLD